VIALPHVYDCPVPDAIASTALPDGAALAEWVSRLVRIPSVSPDHASPRAGRTGEAAIADAVAGWLAGFGGEVERFEALPGRDDVVARFPGRSDRLAVLDVHVDTVGVETMTGDPFGGEVRDGRVYGRGAVDTKASLGVALALLERLHETGARPAPTLMVVATAEEEVGLSGARAFAAFARRRGLAIDELLVGEPTECAPVFGHKGAVRLAIDVRGAAAHTATPELGRNAVVEAARLVGVLVAEHARLQEPGAVPGTSGVLGPPTLTPVLIDGGRAMNVVPDRCRIALDRRVVDGEDPRDVAADLEALLRSKAQLPVEVEVRLERQAFLERADAPFLMRLAEWSGRRPTTVTYGTNAIEYGGLARACVVLGPGSIAQAHGDVEWVEVAELERLAAIYAHWWDPA
jgi:acetylornithine deacetylase/succinyl-diaminopimelate desuccinylase-like protein